MDTKINEYTRTKDGVETKELFTFYTDLKVSDKLKFVKNVTDLVVDKDSYLSIIKDIMFNFMIVEVFTDIDLSEINGSIDTIEEFLNETNVVEIVTENVKEGLMLELRKAVDNNIAYKTGVNNNSVTTVIASLLDTIERQIEKIDMNNFVSMAEKINSLTGDITPEKILDAYTKTDIFKDNKKEREAVMKEYVKKTKKLGIDVVK